MTCPHCGTSNRPAARFCSQCGNQLPAAVPLRGANQLAAADLNDVRQQSRHRQRCFFCGKRLLPGATHCQECGLGLEHARCLKCGGQLPDPAKAKNCTNCGEALPPVICELGQIKRARLEALTRLRIGLAILAIIFGAILIGRLLDGL